jgi:hypothetical protein
MVKKTISRYCPFNVCMFSFYFKFDAKIEHFRRSAAKKNFFQKKRSEIFIRIKSKVVLLSFDIQYLHLEKLN